tara:strand:+ start:422 stop:619 length:198 start_codon:yes stop_codon:yes gene_type:complete
MKSMDKQLKELRDAVTDTATKAAALRLVEAGIKAEDMEAIRAGWQMVDGLTESADLSLNILNGED